MDKTYLKNWLYRNLSEEERREEYAITCHNTFAKNNADRIRSMSDEEMAQELALIAEWDRKQLAKAKKYTGLVQFMLEWLQQPVEE